MSCGGTFRSSSKIPLPVGQGNPRAKADIAKTDLSILRSDEAL